ncbi:Transposase and inactivated derivatives [Kurthia zopfii]|uniref:Transposase and inactivated derivatives n=2 Tax=Kurthia zopfii TaxID=1650 RepID=A0A3S4YUZ9_9BACL|nr:ISL3 family transposase [Kurthia zopfii]STX09911.1 Transposase and inactivated derivatives [Kurthia zopfii]VEI05565.1 Transposase and inactivated derivatives [Kurthia zopfii]VEI05771.1 Transposase and inactivated derivatives [Kurthia zopfii]VEI06187.1 Transposase and inactivated derivatives [Kurthia zopfii]VEI06215.1 Transposase and inactivated derivatives [Kurthia zopfii]
MSINHDIRNLLDIQDSNIHFATNCVNQRLYKGRMSKFISAKLTYTPECCKVCKKENKDFSIIKNGTQESRISLPMMGVHRTFLLLKKQRFFCKSCSSTFVAESEVINRFCFISNQSKSLVTLKASEAQSITLIAQDTSVSPTSVQRFINQFSESMPKKFNDLPKHLSFDEFKYLKGRMAFEYINAKTGTILGILPSRLSRDIKDHFLSRYSYAQRCAVETITIDMNAGYEKLIKELFPKAKIIIDRFHLVQLINRSMNKLRISVMNDFRTSNGADQKKYRRLKKHWKLPLKNALDLSFTSYKNFPLFGQTTDAKVVETLMSYSERLKVNYNLYQSILTALKDKNLEQLTEILEKPLAEGISKDFKRSIKTLKYHLSSIKNSFLFPYNNGRIEGINNKIKVLNRVAYGYRNFENYRNRIYLHFALKRASHAS